MSQETRRSSEERALSKHILPSSGTMIGVCATLIGLVKLAEAHIGPSRVDEYAALASLLFLASAIASYISMRHPEPDAVERTLRDRGRSMLPRRTCRHYGDYAVFRL